MKRKKSNSQKKSEPLHIQQLNKIIEFRKQNEAPVDEESHCEKEKDSVFRFQTLIGLILSSQTRDQQTTNAILSLQTLKGGFTPENVAIQTKQTIKELIKSVSFANTKADRIIEVAQICRDQYKNDIPETYEKLLELPGVGPKIATLTMTMAWKEVVGIGVDVHIHRISNRIGWVSTKKPEQTAKKLQEMFPKELWDPLDVALVGFGQVFCSAKKPKCQDCPISSTCSFNSGASDIEDTYSEHSYDSN